MLELFPQFNEYNNCIENQIYTIVSSKGDNVELAYIDSLYFHFDYERYIAGEWSTLGELIEETYVLYINNLSWLTGLEFQLAYCDIKSLGSEIKRSIDNDNPIIVFLDGYWCPWEGVYQKYKGFSHGIIIKGITNAGYNCTDGHRKIKDCYITKRDLQEGFLGKVVRLKHVTKQEEPISWQKFIRNAGLRAISMKENSAFCNIGYFREAVNRDLDMKREIKGFETNFITIERAPIVERIKKIKCDRKKLEWCLRTIKEKNMQLDIDELIDMAYHSANQWKHIQVLLMKYYYSSDIKYKNKIVDMLDKIAALEEKLAVNMSKIE